MAFCGEPPPQPTSPLGPGSRGGEGKAAACLPWEKQEPTPPLIATLRPAGELTWGVDETLAQLEKVLHLYRSGQYLQNSTADSRAGE